MSLPNQKKESPDMNVVRNAFSKQLSNIDVYQLISIDSLDSATQFCDWNSINQMTSNLVTNKHGYINDSQFGDVSALDSIRPEIYKWIAIMFLIEFQRAIPKANNVFSLVNNKEQVDYSSDLFEVTVNIDESSITINSRIKSHENQLEVLDEEEEVQEATQEKTKKPPTEKKSQNPISTKRKM